MAWGIEYFEQEDGRQPAEEFEDDLDASANRDERRIGGKLLRAAERVAELGPLAGGGYAEKCGEYGFCAAQGELREPEGSGVLWVSR